MDDRRQSALHHRQPIATPDKSARLKELKFNTKIVLRATAEIAERLLAAIDLKRPDTCRFRSGDSGSVWWLSPDEFLILAAPDQAPDLMEKMTAAAGDAHHQVTDVSEYYTQISLEGTAARDVLARLTMIDLHPNTFSKGMAVGTNLALAQSYLALVDDEDDSDGAEFIMMVRWSMADYLWCTLAEAARSFGMPEQHPVDGERMVID